MWGHHHDGMHHGKMKMCMILGLAGGICIITRLMIVTGVIANMISRCGMHRGGMPLGPVCGKKYHHDMGEKPEGEIGMLRGQLQDMQRRLQELERR